MCPFNVIYNTFYCSRFLDKHKGVLISSGDIRIIIPPHNRLNLNTNQFRWKLMFQSLNRRIVLRIISFWCGFSRKKNRSGSSRIFKDDFWWFGGGNEKLNSKKELFHILPKNLFIFLDKIFYFPIQRIKPVKICLCSA